MNTTDQTYAERRATFIAEHADTIPPDVRAALLAEQADLDAADVPSTVLRPGSAMPDGDLLDVHGKTTTLEQTRAGRAAVVVFYRGDWCPYCNLVLRTYQQQLVPSLAALDIPLIAISPQKPDRSMSMRQVNDLTFTVLSDPGNQIARQLGIITAPSRDARAAQLAMGIDVAAGNADGTASMPMPTIVLTNADGAIAWIDVHPDYSTRTEPADILTAITTVLDRPVPAAG
ncbi:peroxiredoxin-like family protein [Nonomuraea basaltis]|uniref:peroxiredoxin-like family protein n=1 Tax=Nonomuraea basaltis TaxID=2495887 RepID=UPI00110C4F83|nr:peroxiredoxin-like family protein [Nonomuraea basaltis]TMR94007.1 AhpC/TSA family protein [Nonomuraea basaltis]